MTRPPIIPAVFYIEFFLDPEYHDQSPDPASLHPVDADYLVTYAFAGRIPADRAGQIQADLDNLADWYQTIFFQNEGDYGVHDACSFPDERVLCLGGYGTYEVPPEQVLDLMTAWHTALSSASEIDGTFGKIVGLPGAVSESDHAVYEKALAPSAHPPE